MGHRQDNDEHAQSSVQEVEPLQAAEGALDRAKPRCEEEIRRPCRDGEEMACWGDNTYGQASLPARTFTAISAGASHTCGVKTSGTVACWGYNASGQSDPPSGLLFSGPAVSAGGAYTCGAEEDGGAVACWGDSSHGQASPPAGRFTAVSAGGDHTCGVRTSGRLACWGDNSSGQATVPPGFG